MPIFIPWCAGPCRHERLVRKWTGQVASHSTLAASLRGSDRSIRHSREGGNPRTNTPRKNANRDTTTYVHTATPLRLSGESAPRTPIRRRNPEAWGEGNVVRSKTSRGEGLVPRWGRGEAWQNPQRQFAVPSHNSNFSYLGVPAAAGMSDWYENDVGGEIDTSCNRARHSR